MPLNLLSLIRLRNEDETSLEHLQPIAIFYSKCYNKEKIRSNLFLFLLLKRNWYFYLLKKEITFFYNIYIFFINSSLTFYFNNHNQKKFFLVKYIFYINRTILFIYIIVFKKIFSSNNIIILWNVKINWVNFYLSKIKSIICKIKKDYIKIFLFRERSRWKH